MVVRSCMTCKKQGAATMEHMMSALPAFRSTAYVPASRIQECTTLAL